MYYNPGSSINMFLIGCLLVISSKAAQSPEIEIKGREHGNSCYISASVEGAITKKAPNGQKQQHSSVVHILMFVKLPCTLDSTFTLFVRRITNFNMFYCDL